MNRPPVDTDAAFVPPEDLPYAQMLSEQDELGPDVIAHVVTRHGPGCSVDLVVTADEGFLCREHLSRAQAYSQQARVMFIPFANVARVEFVPVLPDRGPA